MKNYYATNPKIRLIALRSGAKWWTVGQGVLGEIHACTYMQDRVNRRRFITLLGPTF